MTNACLIAAIDPGVTLLVFLDGLTDSGARGKGRGGAGLVERAQG
jgi:hypothetical protein